MFQNMLQSWEVCHAKKEANYALRMSWPKQLLNKFRLNLD
jgi:hypothetical protein